MMFGYIYKTTDTRNGLIYIGQHISKRFNPFYFGSGRDICAIPYEDRLKYYKVELLHVVEASGNLDYDAQELDRLEIQEIANHHSTDPKIGYNRSKGGQKTAGWYKGTKGRITLHKGDKTIRVHPDYLELYLADGYEKGMSDIQRQKISEITTKIQASEEYREKQRKAQTGKKRTKESRKLLSDAAKKRWNDPTFKESRIGIKIINNGKVERRLPPDEARKHVETGEWHYGRMKMKPRKYKYVRLYNDQLKKGITVKEEDADAYLATGIWRRGAKQMTKEQCEHLSMMRRGRKFMNKNGVVIQAKPEDIERLLKEGWSYGTK